MITPGNNLDGEIIPSVFHKIFQLKTGLYLIILFLLSKTIILVVLGVMIGIDMTIIFTAFQHLDLLTTNGDHNLICNLDGLIMINPINQFITGNLTIIKEKEKIGRLSIKLRINSSNTLKLNIINKKTQAKMTYISSLHFNLIILG